MAGEWSLATFGESARLVRDTVSPSEVGTAPYVGLEHIGEGTLALGSYGTASDVTSAKSRFKRGDILFGKLRPYFRKVIRAPFDGVCSTDIWVVRPQARIDAGFLFYWMASQEFVDLSTKGSEGTKMPRAKWEFVARLRRPIPPLAEQRAIAHILGTLDDKIELNRRMNETLEAMARAIFKSWFVDFDPVHAKAAGRQPHGLDPALAALFPASFEDSELGKIPKGWRACDVPDAIAVNPPRPLRKGDAAPYVEMSNLPNHSARVVAWAPRPFGSGTRFINGDVLVARITPCLENGKTAFVDFLEDGEVAWGSTEFIILHSKPPLPAEFAYLLARTDSFREYAIQNMTGTSGRQRVPANCLDHFLIVAPAEPVAERFGKVVSPFMAAMKANDEQSRTLAAIRDALLPKLLSGEIRVKDAEKLAQEVV